MITINLLFLVVNLGKIDIAPLSVASLFQMYFNARRTVYRCGSELYLDGNFIWG